MCCFVGKQQVKDAPFSLAVGVLSVGSWAFKLDIEMRQHNSFRLDFQCNLRQDSQQQACDVLLLQLALTSNWTLDVHSKQTQAQWINSLQHHNPLGLGDASKISEIILISFLMI